MEQIRMIRTAMERGSYERAMERGSSFCKIVFYLKQTDVAGGRWQVITRIMS